MTRQSIIEPDGAVYTYPDRYRIGQRKEAEIAKASAEKLMAESAFEAFKVGYIDPEWRAMRRRQFAAGRAEYERAKAALEAMS